MKEWQLIATGSNPTALVTTDVIDDLPHGTEFRVIVTTSIPIAPLADWVGAEWVFDKFYNDSGAVLTDVEGIGWNQVVLHFVANSVTLLVLLAVIAFIFATFVYFITKVDVEAFLEKAGEVVGKAGEAIKWVAIGGIGILGLMLLGSLVPSRS